MGVAYNANHIIWFECARTEYMRKEGISYKSLEDMGIIMPVVENYCHYIKPLFYDDEIDVGACIKDLKAASIKFCYLIARNNEKIAEGYTRLAFVDLRFKPVNLKKYNGEVWNKLNSMFENDKGE